MTNGNEFTLLSDYVAGTGGSLPPVLSSTLRRPSVSLSPSLPPLFLLSHSLSLARSLASRIVSAGIKPRYPYTVGAPVRRREVEPGREDDSSSTAELRDSTASPRYRGTSPPWKYEAFRERGQSSSICYFGLTVGSGLLLAFRVTKRYPSFQYAILFPFL